MCSVGRAKVIWVLRWVLGGMPARTEIDQTKIPLLPKISSAVECDRWF